MFNNCAMDYAVGFTRGYMEGIGVGTILVVATIVAYTVGKTKKGKQ